MNKLHLEPFFPEGMLQITEVKLTEKIIDIYLKSKTKGCNYPKCGQLAEQYHGTYVRTMQVLPILGKPSGYILELTNIIV